MTDTITGLPDRQQFMDILHDVVINACEHKISAALLVIKIDRFRRVNHVYGHATGDEVLRLFAGILKQVCRKGDHIARIGSSQFALILSNIANDGHATLAAFKVQRLLDAPFLLERGKILCSAHSGIAICPFHASEAHDLLKEAEIALQRSYQTDQFYFVAKRPQETVISRKWDIEIALNTAIENSELCVYFQPKVSLVTGKPTGAEALIRWNSASHGLQDPGSFLPLVEELGLLKSFTAWMLNSALRLSNKWTRQWGDLEVSVNIPTPLLEHTDFVDLVLSSERLWRNGNITLCLEVLEQYFVTDINNCFAKLNELRSEGINISIDDFGTGYSSLSYFRDIPADELKIDRSFVTGLLADQANANIVALITDLAHKFDLTVVAEGVEDQETLETLKKLKCDKIQGFVIARPMPAPQFEIWLKEYRALDDSADGIACINQ